MDLRPEAARGEGADEFGQGMVKTVVVIHGVGPGAPAETGRAVAQNLGFRVTRHTTVYADGEALLELTDEDTGDSVIEVHWADLLEPKSTATGLLRHISYIVTSMLDVAVRGINGKSSSKSGWLYRLALLTIAPGAVLFTLATAAAVSIENDVHRWLILLTLLIASWLIGRWLWILGQPYAGVLLGVATTVLIAVVFSAALREPIGSTHYSVALSVNIRMLGLGCVVLMLVLAVVEFWLRQCKQPWDTKLAHMALLYLPFIILSGLMSWLGVLGLSYVSDYPKYQEWEAQMWADPMASSRWALIEMATTLLIFVIGIFALLVPAIGYIFGAGPPRSNRRGLGARNGMSLFLAVVPISLLLLLIFVLCVTFGMFPGLPEIVGIHRGIKILEIYQISVLRTLPYLAWLIGPVALVLDVLGDLLFYIQPNKKHPAAIAERCKVRLEAAINFAERKTGGSPGRKVVVLANSQGSKIAADLRDEGKVRCPLVTTGSPVHSLYSRFLGEEKDANQSQENAPWVNCFRDGDVIAGPIERRGVENVLIGRGGHTGYWSDPKMAKIICDLVERPI